LKDYLTQLTNRYGLFWQYDFSNKEIIIFHNQTKTFKLIVPQAEIDNQTTIENTNSGNTSKISYSSSQSDAFKDAIDTIKSFSKDIQVKSNSPYALITVTDSPRVIARVSKYIKEFNDEAQKAVQVKIAIYEVKTTKDSNYGIDWNLVYNGTHTKMNWDTVGLADALSSANLTTATMKLGMNGGMWAGSNIVASALQKYLDATYVQGFNFIIPHEILTRIFRI